MRYENTEGDPCASRADSIIGPCEGLWYSVTSEDSLCVGSLHLKIDETCKRFLPFIKFSLQRFIGVQFGKPGDSNTHPNSDLTLILIFLAHDSWTYHSLCSGSSTRVFCFTVGRPLLRGHRRWTPVICTMG